MRPEEGVKPCASLTADTEGRQETLMSRRVFPTEVTEKPPALPNEHQQASSRCVVVVVDLYVTRQLAYAIREQGHLNIGGAGIRRVRPVLLDDSLPRLAVHPSSA